VWRPRGGAARYDRDRTMKALSIAVIGAGPVGLALALLAARTLPQAQISLFDARPVERDVSGDPRTLALALGSIQLLERIGAWDAARAEPIRQVWVSQQAPALAVPGWLGTPEVRISAIDMAVPMLGAVLAYGALVAPMQRAWERVSAAEPARLHSRFGAGVRR
jgi:2-octaprenyl-6-methoxyphenol hydroxylase